MDALLQVISVEELILKAALESGDAFKGHYLYEEINKLAQEEELHRLTLWNQGTAAVVDEVSMLPWFRRGKEYEDFQQSWIESRGYRRYLLCHLP